ncbi:MAG: marine proteobacterial sortase target protein [Rhodospirillaceae bacterium]|jgi:Ca-activated chloride channel family protein|nr:marine proteobacterial sortase target protein [Rhodospirillaceae bacterium]MBT4688465.1 marine proteobacterial sortase target protein [Rhodospirillaceae bacterium]MBT5079860.1 marine proteobacterial sortase target protein [Rhodospirillaceae bacterium]MBT5879444.1 marine proteobacterial sortase target protein [Rhodospirillaceae bacterium]MBT6591943.1 marine proteobacterial sortase target protein [Rhodospirillaceae bacterium]
MSSANPTNPTNRTGQTAKTDRFAVLIMNILAGLILTFAVTAAASAAVPEQMGEGSLLLRAKGEGAYRAAIAQKSDVEIDVSGLIARAKVRQEFTNSSDSWMEGIYVFPLPHKAAVDGLRLTIGERVIEGRIEERQKAQRDYAQAKREGKKAGLVEAERPNIFTTSIANIAPGETVRIEIRYQQVLAYANGEFRLRFPMVVGPRYIPGQANGAVQLAKFGSNGWEDGARITQPVSDVAAKPGPKGQPSLNPVTLTVRLNPGMPLADVTSHHHGIVVEAKSEGRRIITLAQDPVPADRDFELTWRPKPDAAPQAGLFVESDAPSQTGPHIRHALLMLVPPMVKSDDNAPPARELLFVLDTSGSMGGASIRQAKAALLRAMDSLSAGDYFNIVEFNNKHSRLFATSMKANPAHLNQAKGWISGLQAGGGTEMAPALKAALSQAAIPGVLRQVVFLTDGAVGNEADLFALINQHLGSARLFTIGIGSAPNSHFMRGAAQAGRGSFLHIGSTAQIGPRIDDLITKLSHPAMTDIQVRFDSGGSAQLARDPIPDLYAGEPLVIAAKLTGRVGAMTVTGRRGGKVWQQSLDLQGGQQGVGIGKLWAQRKITALEDQPPRQGPEDTRHRNNPGELDAQVLALAMDYGLVSRLTALIAIDQLVARGSEDPLLSQRMSANLPQGWKYKKVFGNGAAMEDRQASMVSLPATGTAADILMICGLLLVLLALALMAPMVLPTLGRNWGRRGKVMQS